MKYLCLIYYNEANLAALSKPEFDALVEEALEYDQGLQKNGQHIFSSALQSVQTAATVRLNNGASFTTDGPFAETKEQLGGFVIIEAKDLNEAIRIGAGLPPGRLGCVEVRPVMELPLEGTYQWEDRR
jgi:hypothetical protein